MLQEHPFLSRRSVTYYPPISLYSFHNHTPDGSKMSPVENINGKINENINGHFSSDQLFPMQYLI